MCGGLELSDAVRVPSAEMTRVHSQHKIFNHLSFLRNVTEPLACTKNGLIHFLVLGGTLTQNL